MESRDHPLRAGGHLGGHRVGAMFDSGLKMRAWPWHPAHLVSRSSLVLRRWKAGHYSTPSVEMGGRARQCRGRLIFGRIAGHFGDDRVAMDGLARRDSDGHIADSQG